MGRLGDSIRLQPRACRRARRLTSEEIDGELAREDASWLGSHRSRCRRCHDWQRWTLSITAAIREGLA